MLKLKIPSNRMNYLIEAVEVHMDPTILERGWDYYHKGYVLKTDLTDGIHLQAQVYGTQKYEVSLHLENFSRSTCNCPFDDGLCKHIAAVFFHTYSVHGRAEMLLRQLVHSMQASKNRSKAMAVKKAIPTEKPLTLKSKDLPREWHKFFDLRYRGYMLNHQNSIEAFYSAALADLTDLASSWNEPIRRLYSIHVLLFIMRKIEQFHQMKQTSYLSYFHESGCQNVANLCVEKIFELANQYWGSGLGLVSIHSKSIQGKAQDDGEMNIAIITDHGVENRADKQAELNELIVKDELDELKELNELDELGELKMKLIQERRDYPKHWAETAAYVGEIALTGKISPVEWLTVYRFLWWTLFDRETLGTQERLRLQTLREQLLQPSRKRDVLSIALSHFALMDGEDDKAMELLKGLQSKQLADFYMVLKSFTLMEKWDQLLIWLRWLLPVMPNSKQDDFHKVCTFWMEAMKHQSSDEEWIRVMLSLLPRSYHYYTDYLMKTERFRQWVDLQLSNQISPASLYSGELKLVETHDPALLLPLYHQAAEKLILEKNRASYKTAVRYLKKLHTCYKRIKQLERWDDFIYRLGKKHSRLRAFQEELQRVKWLN